MQLGRDQLIFRALVVLDEAVEASRTTPIKPGAGLRFALMFLHTIGQGEKRHCDDFWREVQTARPDGCGTDRGGFRAQHMRTAMTAIARSVGVHLTADYEAKLYVARMPNDERTAHRQRETELAEHRRRLIEDGWQYQADDRAEAERAAATDRGASASTIRVRVRIMAE